MLTINNFGHFWSRELIDWGWKGKGNQGSLKGSAKLTDLTLENGVDFREQAGIYVLFSNEREVVYVGQTGSGKQRLLKRLKAHARGAMRDRWTNFSWFGFLGVGNDGCLIEREEETKIQGEYVDALDEIESILLQLFEPRLNKQGPKWKESVEYFQCDERENWSNDDIGEKLCEIEELVSERN